MRDATGEEELKIGVLDLDVFQGFKPEPSSFLHIIAKKMTHKSPTVVLSMLRVNEHPLASCGISSQEISA